MLWTLIFKASFMSLTCIANKTGDKLSPYLKPFLHLMLLAKVLLTFTLDVTVLVYIIR